MFNICSLCRKLATLRCGGCKTEVYCSPLCQSEAWKVHKRLCNLPSRKFVVQPDLTLTEAQIMLQANNPCSCCTASEVKRKNEIFSDDSTPASILEVFTDDRKDPEGKNEAIATARATLLNDLAPVLLEKLRHFIKKERLSPFYRIAFVQCQAYQDQLGFNIPKLAQSVLAEFFTYFTIVEVVKDSTRSLECRDITMKRLKPLIESLKKAKGLGWQELYASYKALKSVHSGYHDFVDGKIDKFDHELLIGVFDWIRTYEVEGRSAEEEEKRVRNILKDEDHVEHSL